MNPDQRLSQQNVEQDVVVFDPLQGSGGKGHVQTLNRIGETPRRWPRGSL
jgi:hypothetical protein